MPGETGGMMETTEICRDSYDVALDARVQLVESRLALIAGDDVLSARKFCGALRKAFESGRLARVEHSPMSFQLADEPELASRWQDGFDFVAGIEAWSDMKWHPDTRGCTEARMSVTRTADGYVPRLGVKYWGDEPSMRSQHTRATLAEAIAGAEAMLRDWYLVEA
ncbi:hypothetical protein [Burkholderia gladioli]|uniref:hypothetical protein n=2 Tax=Burkholderia gladioli TaxID=28095 RepID=UPI000F54667B|nr:hypothetical protein [Burkholderia gladioli]